jgi:hypothetical protein
MRNEQTRSLNSIFGAGASMFWLSDGPVLAKIEKKRDSHFHACQPLQ